MLAFDIPNDPFGVKAALQIIASQIVNRCSIFNIPTGPFGSKADLRHQKSIPPNVLD